VYGQDQITAESVSDMEMEAIKQTLEQQGETNQELIVKEEIQLMPRRANFRG
jgi:hypothetical protein